MDKINNKSNPLISVIVPVYNGQDVIGDCIQSLLESDYSDEKYEIVIVDNNSKDKTAEIVKKFSVRYLFETEKGPSAARNTGAKNAKGNILAFTDADVLVDKNWLSSVEKAFRIDPAVSAIMGKRSGINKNFWAECSQKSDEIHETIMEAQGVDLKEIDTRNFSIKKEVFMELGGFNTSIMNAEDFELGLRLYHSGHRIGFNKTINIRHINPTSPWTIIKARREQSFHSYNFSKNYDIEQRKRYFPNLYKTRYRVLFAENNFLAKPMLIILNIIMPIAINLSVFLVRLLKSLKMRKMAADLFIFSLRFPTFHGKILARCVEKGYLSQEMCYKSKIFKR